MISSALRRDLSREPYERLVGRVSGRGVSGGMGAGSHASSGFMRGRVESPAAGRKQGREGRPGSSRSIEPVRPIVHAHPRHACRRCGARAMPQARGRGTRPARIELGWPAHSASRAGRADDLGRRSRRPPSRRSVAVGGLSIGGTASRPPFPHVTLAVSNRQLSSHAHPLWMRTMREWLHPLSGDPYERQAAEVSAPRVEPLRSVVTRPGVEPLQPVVGRPRW